MAQTMAARKVLVSCWRGILGIGYAVAAVTSFAGAMFALYIAVVGSLFFKSLFMLAALVPTTLNLCYLALVVALATGRAGQDQRFSAFSALPILLLLPLEVLGNLWFFNLWRGM